MSGIMQRVVWCLIIVCSAQAESVLMQRLHNVIRKDHMRLVWTRDADGNRGFPNSGVSTDQVLMGLDSKVGVADTFQSTVANYQRPMISKDGSLIVYSQTSGTQRGKIFAVDWGKNATPRQIASGMAGCLWFDSVTNKEYAIYARNCPFKGECEVHRVNIRDSSDHQYVYNRGLGTVVGHWLMMNKAGTRIGCVWGWPVLQVFDIATSSASVTGNGCWASLTYDDQDLVIALEPEHKGWMVFRPVSGQTVNIPTDSTKTTVLIDNFKLISYSSTIAVCMWGVGTSGAGSINVMRMSSSLVGLLDSVTVTNTTNDCFPDGWIPPSTVATAPRLSEDHRAPARDLVGPWDDNARSVRVVGLDGREVASGQGAGVGARFAGLPRGVYVVVSPAARTSMRHAVLNR